MVDRQLRAARDSRGSHSVALGQADPRTRRSLQGGVTDNEIDADSIILDKKNRLSVSVAFIRKIVQEELAKT